MPTPASSPSQQPLRHAGTHGAILEESDRRRQGGSGQNEGQIDADDDDDDDDADDFLTLPPLPQDDSSLMGLPSEDGDSNMDKTVDERELKRKLMEIESSFLPGHDSVMFTAPQDEYSTRQVSKLAMPPPPHPRLYKALTLASSTLQVASATQPDARSRSESPSALSDAHRTNAIRRDLLDTDESSMLEDQGEDDTNLSSLENMSSSPTAAAAARSISRAVSAATASGASGYHTAEDRSPERKPEKVKADDDNGDEDQQDTPKKPMRIPDIRPPDHSRPSRSPTRASSKALDTESERAIASFPSRRLPSLSNQRDGLRNSASSMTSSKMSQDRASDTTVDVPSMTHRRDLNGIEDSPSRPSFGHSRHTSLGSIASGVTGLEESTNGEIRRRSVSGTSVMTMSMMAEYDRNLARLDEERASDGESLSGTSRSVPKTPKNSSRALTAPTDTVIAQHVRDIQVPASVAREFSRNHRPSSPEKRAGPTAPMSARGKGLTLKEQSSTIDRLQKENFDLKLKIHYLNQALNERSEEGVKEMISENVELKAGLVMMEKQARTLRKSLRDLERLMREKEEGTAAAAAAAQADDIRAGSAPTTSEHGQTEEMAEEITYLRERVETYESELERVRSESVAREGEKRRMAEVIKSVGNRRTADPDLGAREETNMWKDLLEGETARREQADTENQRQREELWRLKNADAVSPTSHQSATQSRSTPLFSKRRAIPARTYSGGSTTTTTEERNGAPSAASSTLVEQLRHENEELRREVGAQTSMLTSRNREKERLYQEIEDLKLGHMRGDAGRSMTGDSILERSASRGHIRNASRVSTETRTALYDEEREMFEAKHGALRDENSTLKLTNQELERNLEATLDDLDQVEAAHRELTQTVADFQEEVQLLTTDLQTMQAERDEVLGQREEMDTEFRNLKEEAQVEINALEAELDRKAEELQHLEQEMANRDENFNALQAEMRSLSEGVVRLEDDHQAKGRKNQSLQQELDDATAEIESIERILREANGKLDRFTVQQESSQSEIAFLREEQDGDKIKIGDLESALTEAESSLQEEKERIRELEKRLVDERHQRELIGSKEKQEVQRALNDLNRDASAAKDEARRLRKTLSAREIEATEWKERLVELENNLREALGGLTGTRSSLLTAVTKLQKELEETVADLEATRNALAEKDRVFRHRDALLEDTGMESRRLAELLERERQARRADEFKYENLQRTTQHSARTVTQHEARVKELETGRVGDKKKLAVQEEKYNSQLLERNNLLLALWNRLSTLCGTDWAHRNTLVNGRLPSIEVVASMLPGFGKNLLLAMKTVEGLIGGFRSKIRTVEKDLHRQYTTLEHDLELRGKKLDRLESLVHGRRPASGHSTAALSTSSEVYRLRTEIRTLKHDLSSLQQRTDGQPSAAPRGPPANIPIRDVSRRAVSQLSRHQSTSTMGTSAGGGSGGSVVGERQADTPESVYEIPEDDPVEQRWVHRLRELERRLKAEREARLMDRNGARKRLEEGRLENEELRMELEREKVRRLEGPHATVESAT